MSLKIHHVVALLVASPPRLKCEEIDVGWGQLTEPQSMKRLWSAGFHRRTEMRICLSAERPFPHRSTLQIPSTSRYSRGGLGTRKVSYAARNAHTCIEPCFEGVQALSINRNIKSITLKTERRGRVRVCSGRRVSEGFP
jgi:hypothetical protein